MSFLQRPFKLGKILLPSNVFYSPLAGCSDFPFRQMAAQYAPGLMYCEMVKMDALIRHDPNTFHILDYNDLMRPIGAQIVGSKVEIAGEAARIIEDLGFDVIDLNCGCPVDKVTKGGGGSGLLKEPRLIGDLIAAMVAAVNLPVTVKIRAGWDEQSINVAEITRIAEEAGAQAIAVHGRTRKQAYKGPAIWDYIRMAKEAAKEIKVIGNGDVFDPLSAEAMFQATGCDAVLASRGTLGSPWLAQDICHYLETGELVERGGEERRLALQEHFAMTRSYHHPKRAIVDMRKVGCWYIKRRSGTTEFRRKMSRASTLDEVAQLIGEFPVEQGEVESG